MEYNAFERAYDEDHSWEELQEDEFGNLRPLVWRGGGAAGGRERRRIFRLQNPVQSRVRRQHLSRQALL